MKINKTFCKSTFDVNDIPNWACPQCNTGILVATEKDIQPIEAAQSIQNREEHGESGNWEPDWDFGVFLGKLSCQNRKCEERIAFSGKTSIVYSFDKEKNEGSHELYIEPKYFSTPIKLFPLHEGNPKNINAILSEAFGLFWIDLSSCANKIRVLVEKVLDQQKIAKYPKSGKRIPISLHKRIELFRKLNAEAAHYFEAIKWIGNAGSHDTNKINKDELISAFEIIGEALNILYNPHTNELKALAGKIIKRKGPVKKSSTLTQH